jgi:hypothetical protein
LQPLRFLSSAREFAVRFPACLIGLQRINLFRQRLNSLFGIGGNASLTMLPICSSSSLVKGMSPSVLWFGAGCSCGVNRALNLLATTATHDSWRYCGAGVVEGNNAPSDL